jgi:predicted NBD/HSP70 family sugar kinase
MHLIFDIGGTHIRGAISDGRTLVQKKIVDTPQSFLEGMSLISSLKKELEENNQIDTTLCGIAGVLQSNKQSLFVSPNLPDWVGKPLSQELETICSMPVSIENDAALAGLGEAEYGAGKGSNIIMYYTIGTGIGGVRIVNKRIDSHVFGFEPGQQIVSKDTLQTLESFTSGGSIEKKQGLSPTEIHNKEFWKDITKDLSIGIYNSMLHWSPEIIVLGGGLINQNVISIHQAEHELSLLNKMYPTIPAIKKSQFGDESGLYGGMAYLNSI